MNKTTVPFFSVIVPIYNNEKDIGKCISSILAQTYKEFEVILVDDGSTDKSSQICDCFAEKDDRIQVIHRKENGGVTVARNDGLFNARGNYVYYVDGDDWIAEELLAKASQELARESLLDMFVFCYVRVCEKDKFAARILKVEEGLYNKAKLKRKVYPSMICNVGKNILEGIDSGSLCDKIIKRELLMEHYCRNVAIFRGEDSVCAWECLYFAERVFFSKETMYFYNQLSASSGQKEYHPDLYENNKAVASYLRTHLHAEENFQIERQINALDFRGAIDAIHQEINFHHSILEAARFLKAKMCCKEFRKYSYRGLPVKEYPNIMLLNLRCVYILILWTVICYCFFDIGKMLKKWMQLFFLKN